MSASKADGRTALTTSGAHDALERFGELIERLRGLGNRVPEAGGQDGRLTECLGDAVAECRALAAEFQTVSEHLAGHCKNQVRQEADLRASRETLQAFMDAVTESALLIKHDGTLLAINKTAADRLNLDPDVTVGQSIYAMIPPAVAERRKTYVSEVLRDRRPIRFLDDRNGRVIENSVYPVVDVDGTVTRIAIVGIDITERQKLEAALRESRRQLDALIANLPGIAYRCKSDRHRTMEFLSDGCEELTGYRPEELVGNARIGYSDLIREEDRAPVWDSVQDGVAKGGLFKVVYRIRSRDGQEKWALEQGRGVFDDAGNLQAFEGFVSDITEQRLAELRLKHALTEMQHLNSALEESRTLMAELATHDPLTGLYNRRELEIALREEFGRTQRHGEPFGLLILDLDHFKRVNDTWGHPIGDQVLVAVSTLLKHEIPVSDRLIRYGGEEFAIVASGSTPSQSEALAERIRDRLARSPVEVMTQLGMKEMINIFVSIGIACAPKDGLDEDHLVNAADAALYRAKTLGRNRCERAIANSPLPLAAV